jgi:hypothetical protein
LVSFVNIIADFCELYLIILYIVTYTEIDLVLKRKSSYTKMPIYPPRNTATKKSQILDYKIFEFLRSIKPEQSKEKIHKKAEQVRIAMLNLIKVRLSLTKSYKADSKSKTFIQLQEKLNSEMENWKSFTFDEIKKFCLKNED